jgi:hypothetical protein
MRITQNEDKQIVGEVLVALKANDWYCPCKIEHLPENKCMCEDFRLNTAEGEYCHCGLYKKLEN